MTDYVEAGVRLIADVSDAEDALNNLIDLASTFDSPIEISVTADTSDVDSELSALDSESIEPEVIPSYDDSNILPFDELDGEEVEPTVNPQMSEEGQGILDTLKSIQLMTAVNLVINVAGTVLDFLDAWKDFTVGPLLAIDTGMAEFEARTGAAIPNAHELFTKIMGEDLATGVDQITAVLTHAQQLHLPLEEAATAALTFTKVFPENDPAQVLDTLDSMVKNELVPNLTAGSDLLVAGLQQGANKGGDLLSVLGRNASALKDLGLTGPQSIQLITNALAGGASSATDVVMELQKIKQNITMQTTAGQGAALDVLAQLNIPNPITSGQGWTADFFTSVSDAIKNAPVDEATKQQMFAALVGGKLAQKDYQGFLNIDAAQGAFDQLAGVGATAATKIDDSLSGAVDDFVLAAQLAATDFLSSNQIDLPGKIAALKTGLQDGLAALQEGGTLGEALTIALKPVGLDETFQRLEAGLTQFIISILQVIASIQDLTGHGDQAALTRGSIAGLVEHKLAIDLQINNPDEIVKTVGDALKSGLAPEDYANALNDGIKALVNSGEFQKAQALLDASQTVQIQLPVGSNLDPAVVAAQIDAVQAAAQTLIDQAQIVTAAVPKTPVASQGPTMATDSSGHTLGLSASVDDLTTSSDKASPAVKGVKDKVDLLGDAAAIAATPINHLGTTASGTSQPVSILTTRISAMVPPFSSVTTAANDAAARSILAAHGLNEIAQSAPNATSALNFMAEAIGNVQAAANAGAGGTPAKGAGAGHAAMGSDDTGGVGFWAGEEGPEYITSDRSLAVLNNRTMQAIMQAVSGAAGRGGVSNNSNSKVFNLTQNNFVPNTAVADTLGYATASQMRGV